MDNPQGKDPQEPQANSSTVEGEVIEPVNANPKQEDIRDLQTGRFMPGKSGNPHGRPPREWSWSSLIESTADDYKEVKNGGKIQWKKLIVRRLFTEAANGNMGAIREIFDRMDGKAAQNIQIGGMQLPQPITEALTKVLTPTDNELSNNDSDKETEQPK